MKTGRRFGRLRWVIMSVLSAVVTLTVVLSTAAQPAPPDLSQMRVVAVAPFADEVGMREDLARWAALRLSQLLSRERLQVISFEQVERGVREMGLRLSDLISPTATADLGRRLGADVVVTGRLIRADQERRLIGDSTERMPREAFVTLDLRVMVVATRRTYNVEVAGQAIGFTGLARAADQALQEFIGLLNQLRASR